MTEICSCCKKEKADVPRMIKFSDDQYLCNVCSKEIYDLFISLQKEEANPKVDGKIYPKDIKSFLDEYVIGQDDAKRVLAVEVYNHYQRINNLDQEIEKSNILMIGNSGSGKTLLVKTLAKKLDLPLAICDATNLTEAGYVGNDIETILQQLVIAANGNIKEAEKGIIFIDEIDKLAKQHSPSGGSKDPSGLGVQQGLLKIIEGAVVPLKTEPKGPKDYIDTSNILFIGAGAFYGLDKVVEAKQKGKTTAIGFSATVETPSVAGIEVKEEDLIEYGLLPEFISRLPVVVQLSQLTKEDYRKILIEPKNSVIKQYQNLMALEGIELNFTEGCIDEIVESVYKSKRGARALRTMVEKSMRNIIFGLGQDSEKVYTIETLKGL